MNDNLTGKVQKAVIKKRNLIPRSFIVTEKTCVYGSSCLFSIPGTGFPVATTRMCKMFTVFL